MWTSKNLLISQILLIYSFRIKCQCPFAGTSLGKGETHQMYCKAKGNSNKKLLDLCKSTICTINNREKKKKPEIS